VQTIFNTSTVQVVIQQRDSSGSGYNGGMIAAIASIVSLIVVGSGVGYVIYRRYQRRLEEIRANKTKPLDSSHATRANIVDKSSPDAGVSPDQFDDDDRFDEQYHPNIPSIDIFAHGDIIKKVNQADLVDHGAIDSDDEVDNQSSGAGSQSNGVSNGITYTHGESGVIVPSNEPAGQVHENAPMSTFSLGTSQQSNNPA
jgi:hypothetical protein